VPLTFDLKIPRFSIMYHNSLREFDDRVFSKLLTSLIAESSLYILCHTTQRTLSVGNCNLSNLNEILFSLNQIFSCIIEFISEVSLAIASKKFYLKLETLHLQIVCIIFLSKMVRDYLDG